MKKRQASTGRGEQPLASQSGKRRVRPKQNSKGKSVSGGERAQASELMDRARMQWQFGDWESLVAMDFQDVEADPGREVLVGMIAAAHLQLGNQSDGRSLATLALDWGCDRRLLARILIAGASNILGRVAASRGQEGRALRHFRDAVEGGGGDARLASQARALSEITRLDLLDQVLNVAKMQRSERLLHRDSRFAPGSGQRSIVDSGSEGAKSEKVRPDALRGAIVIAGMRHSGSTALFNIVRLALEQKGIEFASFYSEGQHGEKIEDPDAPLLLIKTHEFRDDVAARANLVITTRRDLRDTVASAVRRGFPILKGLGGAVEYAKYNRTLHDIWQSLSDYEFVYEDYMQHPLQEISRLLRFIGFNEIDPEPLYEAVVSLPTNQYSTSLLSPIHITDPQRVLSYEDTLPEGDVARITRDHEAWLRRYGYTAAWAS